MTRSKTLSISLIAALIASIVVPANAQVFFGTGSTKEYRQFRGKTSFRGGLFETFMRDGLLVYILGCESPFYRGPDPGADFCPAGTTAFLIAGNLADAEILEAEQANFFSGNGPYFEVASITPATVVAPNYADKVQLVAAPASSLTRPSGGFEDRSFTVLSNIQTSQIREFPITIYQKISRYTKSQGDKFISDIVPGVYVYALPSISSPDIPRVLRSTILPITETVREVNNQVKGFEFTQINNNKLTKKGFVEMSVNKRNIIRWKGFTPSDVFLRTDRLFVSIRALENPKNPNSDVRRLVPGIVEIPQSIFPNFNSGQNPRILIPNPFATSYTVPTIIRGGTSAVLEIELDRGSLEGNEGTDFSTRRFQVPITFVDRYSEYRETNFGRDGKDNKPLDDSDNDGYNNLTEWVLGTSANTKASFPFNPVPTKVASETIITRSNDRFFSFFEFTRAEYFGFTIRKKQGTVPSVDYILQRSKDGGVTWSTFESDNNWEVTTVNPTQTANEIALNLPKSTEIRVEAVTRVTPTESFPFSFFSLLSQPPGTENDLYRVKITKAPK